MKKIEIIKEEMNRLGWSKIDHKINFDDIKYFKKEMIKNKKLEIKNKGEEFLRKNNHLDIIKCHFQFKEKYIQLIESKWLNEIVDNLLNETAIIYDFFGLLNIDQKNASHHRNKFHQDQAYLGGIRASILIIIPLIDFIEKVGPTEIIPCSHLFKNKPSQEFIESNYIKLIAKKGEVFVVDASVWHRGGDNKTQKIRPAIIIRYQLPFLKRPIDLTEHYKEELKTSSNLIKKRMGIDCREMNSLEEIFEPDIKFKKGQYNLEGLFYNE